MTINFGNPYVSAPTSPAYEDAGVDVPLETPYVYYDVDLGASSGGGGDPVDGNCDPRPTNGMIYPRRLPVAGRQ